MEPYIFEDGTQGAIATFSAIMADGSGKVEIFINDVGHLCASPEVVAWWSNIELILKSLVEDEKIVGYIYKCIDFAVGNGT